MQMKRKIPTIMQMITKFYFNSRNHAPVFFFFFISFEKKVHLKSKGVLCSMHL